MTLECQHGHQSRTCERCEDAAEIAELRADIKSAEEGATICNDYANHCEDVMDLANACAASFSASLDRANRLLREAAPRIGHADECAWRHGHACDCLLGRIDAHLSEKPAAPAKGKCRAAWPGHPDTVCSQSLPCPFHPQPAPAPREWSTAIHTETK